MHHFQAKRLPDSFEDYFTCIAQQSKYVTRGSSAQHDFRLPLFRTNKLQHSIKFQGAKFWNSLPNKIKVSDFTKFIKLT